MLLLSCFVFYCWVITLSHYLTTKYFSLHLFWERRSTNIAVTVKISQMLLKYDCWLSSEELRRVPKMSCFVSFIHFPRRHWCLGVQFTANLIVTCFVTSTPQKSQMSGGSPKKSLAWGGDGLASESYSLVQWPKDMTFAKAARYVGLDALAWTR